VLAIAIVCGTGCAQQAEAAGDSAAENGFSSGDTQNTGTGGATGGAGGSGSAASSSGGITGSGSASSTGGAGATDPGGTGGASTAGAAGSGPGSGATSLTVRLVPQAGVSGTEHVNFAVPFSPGALMDAAAIRVLSSGTELGARTRVLARHADGSVRSLELQLELAVTGETDLEVHVGEPSSAAAPSPVSVESTLVAADGTQGPRVWALLPAEWIAESGIAGPLLTEDAVRGTPLSAWSKVCDYATYDVDAFRANMTDATVWLYDRGTAFYRGYGQRGDLTTLETAYRETAIYRSGLTGSGASTTIGVPGKSDDLKYHYAQNLALHYLFTGDDRFREAAENVADKVAALWPNPGYAGGTDFWTERHAGFALLAYVWAGIVSDDRAAEFLGRADAAVDSYVDLQNSFPSGYGDAAARCFAHQADAAGEPFGYFGCSPWMSAILADALDAYATERGGDRATNARNAVVKLGRILARDGRDSAGRPYYWMGVGGQTSEADTYDEHWGESAYVVAMAYDFDGRRDAALKTAADELVTGLSTHGTAPHMRSMNWQCRSAVAAPYFLGL